MLCVAFSLWDRQSILILIDNSLAFLIVVLLGCNLHSLLLNCDVTTGPKQAFIVLACPMRYLSYAT